MIQLSEIIGIAGSPIGNKSSYQLLKLSIGTEEQKAEFCRIIEENNPAIIPLAADIADIGLVFGPLIYQRVDQGPRHFGFKIYMQPGGYVVASGVRRVLAIAYNHAKHGHLPIIKCNNG